MNTIKSSDEISLIFKEGKRISLPDLNLIICELPLQRDRQGRVAFIAGKKHGNAVWRNRAKRRMRALYQDVSQEWIDMFNGYDVLFVARCRINKVSYQKLITQVRNGLLPIEKQDNLKAIHE